MFAALFRTSSFRRVREKLGDVCDHLHTFCFDLFVELFGKIPPSWSLPTAFVVRGSITRGLSLLHLDSLVRVIYEMNLIAPGLVK